jgi:hypothetical protein
MQDKSIIQPVLRAVEHMQSSPEELAALYRIVDQFSSEWLGRPREEMRFEGDAVLYLIHDLLGEYLRLEENHKRLAFWLLTLNRCCLNFTADLRQTRAELQQALAGTDLSLDTTLLEPVFETVHEYEEGHRLAVREKLGRGDRLGGFLQWVGTYCGYIYPIYIRGSDPVNRTVISSITFLTAEYIKLRSNVYRVAALLLGIKEACAIGTALARVQAGLAAAEPLAGEPGGEEEASVMAGQDREYVEALLGRLRQEGGRNG